MGAMPQAARWRRAFLSACVASCAISVAAPQVQAQSLFEVLFGRQSIFAPPPPLYQPGLERRPPPLRRPREHVIAPRRIEPVDAKPEKYVPPEVMPGPLGQFLRDPTLRRGDVVATSKGLMVFRGQGGARHAERDFVGLSNATGFTAGNRANLVALERSLKRGRTSQHAGERLARSAPVVAQEDKPVR
jgi:hypothetical protein